MGGRRVVETGIRHRSTGRLRATSERNSHRAWGSRVGCGSASRSFSTMAATTAEPVNGISTGFQWSPGIVACDPFTRLSSHPFPSSGQISTQS